MDKVIDEKNIWLVKCKRSGIFKTVDILGLVSACCLKEAKYRANERFGVKCYVSPLLKATIHEVNHACIADKEYAHAERAIEEMEKEALI